MESPTLAISVVDEAGTVLLAQDIAMALAAGDCLALSGELGAGKSTLARALLRAVADDEALEVPSPTFTLVQIYELRLHIGHFDLYRIGSADELDELGLEDVLERGVALVEWPERGAGRLPATMARICISGAGDVRRFDIDGPAPFMGRLERSRQIRAFLDTHGQKGAPRRLLQGDASARTYETVGPNRPGGLIVMNAPRKPDGPPIENGLPYSRIAHLAEDVNPFVAIGGWLSREGFAAPAISAIDLEGGLLLIENLGDGKILDPEGRPDPVRYRAAVELLADLHERPVPGPLPVAGGAVYSPPAYDASAMRIEVALLVDWYLPWRSGAPVPESRRSTYFKLWQDLFDALAEAETAVVLRDYHSPNLIWCPALSGHARIGLIDFQDAVIGPSAYDVASLVQDARVTIEPDLAADLLACYEARRREACAEFSGVAFRKAHAIVAAQRAAKILGIFVRLDKRDGKPAYLRHLPRIERYIAASLAHEALHPLRSWFEEAGIGAPRSGRVKAPKP